MQGPHTDLAAKACDRCRVKKLKCDRGSPCSICRERDLTCTKSPRVARPRRRHQPVSARNTGGTTSPRPQWEAAHGAGSLPTPSGATTCQGFEPAVARRTSSSAARPSISGFTGACTDGDERTSPRRQSPWNANRTVNSLAFVEGPTSLSAHSTMAMSFLDRVVVNDRQQGHDIDTRSLLHGLEQMVQAIRMHKVLTDEFSDMTRQTPSSDRRGSMPPIEASVAAIGKAQATEAVVLSFIETLLSGRGLSDLCLRVYFSNDHSEADYIILNAALRFFFDKSMTSDDDTAATKIAGEHQARCQKNLEMAILALPLHIVPTHEIVLALVLGAVHAVDVLKPHWAWTLITTAYQAAFSLGCHLRKGPSSTFSENANPAGLLFWVIYFIEKNLCLRLGRHSIIPDGEITVTLPGGSPGMEYARTVIQLAGVAGKIYKQLYGPEAQEALQQQQQLPVQELSQELQDVSARSQEALRVWLRFNKSPGWKDTIEFLSYSDTVLLHSLQTLIHRTSSTTSGAPSRMTSDCVESARLALACHASSPVVVAGTQSVFLSAYMSWFIILRPFTPFLVLFCNVLETGDQDDLGRMKRFVDSLKALDPDSEIARKHQRLFQVFYDVAMNYSELKSQTLLPHDGGADALLWHQEADAYLNAMGLWTTSEGGSNPAQGLDTNASGTGDGQSWQTTEPDPHTAYLPHWFQVSQQMTGLVDDEQFLL
ncbi:hypothetical protein BDZ85DRAFT_269360 [Elsinoe ampelina]|uniref:Zn(2)-C6 fungal-type domain-containing protein n=1 Tax=Elsinoe ampelina TaxID=302913 RepID=A0A6A6FZW9_9PEZI|nr:hypothetical protein BDZ85DRAFT_269360 [Elsinoe ampelina]